MQRELAEIKIEAFLHDPPGKVPTLWYRRHEDFSTRLVELVLGRAPQHGDRVRKADQYASAVDRTALPRDPVEFCVDFLRHPRIVHPLSGTRYELRPLLDLDPGRIEDEQQRAVQRLVERGGGAGANPERLYWYVWRGLEEALTDQGEVGKLWRYLPADTRIPDHSIWDHMRLTAAFAGASPAPALLLFSFGPVQALIEAARRTGDLWAGSFLLSWLAWRAMRDLVAEFGADAVLFPDLHRQPLVDGWLRERGWTDIPGLSDGSRVASLPNRFLALVPTDEGKRLAQRCEESLQEAGREFARECVGELFEGVAADGPVSRAMRQVEDTLNCQWHVLPWGDDGQGLEERSRRVLDEAIAHFWETRAALSGQTLYRPNRGTYFAVRSGLVEAAHGAAKASRRFTQIDEQGRRCTVCGTREALWQEPAERPRQRLRSLRPEERLCGLCAARRAAPKSGWARGLTGEPVIFPSTHNLAATGFFQEVMKRMARAESPDASGADREVAEAVVTFVQAVAEADRAFATPALIRQARGCGGRRDVAERLVKLPAELLDPATYEPTALEDGALEELGIDRSRAPQAREALQTLMKACDRAGVLPPRAYYAVLVMDGDHMGHWLSGEKAPYIRDVLHEGAMPREHAPYLDRRRPLSSAHQVAVSRALNQFALEVVEPVVEDVHGGVVVYAGGDDALAMLPLQAVLPCVRDLRRLYAGLPLHRGSRAAKRGFESGGGHVRRGGKLWRVMGETATCSIGVAIAHQKWPLRRAIEVARQMEKDLAKRGLERNAVAIALLKRSGGHEHFGARWGAKDGVREPDPVAVLEAVATLIAEGRVSRRFAYALREEARVLWPMKDALRDRAYWLLDRHWRKGSVPFGAAAAKDLAEDLRGLAEFLDGTPLRSGVRAEGREPLDRFVAGLGLAEFIAREGGAGEE
jgi:CRISPR-associated protein Cmr2